MPDPYGYPTDRELNYLATFAGTARQFIDEIKALWIYPDYITESWNEETNTLTLEVSTGGWSGHETIIDALQITMFWTLYWQNTRRGGHYTFHVTDTASDWKYWGNLQHATQPSERSGP